MSTRRKQKIKTRSAVRSNQFRVYKRAVLFLFLIGIIVSLCAAVVFAVRDFLKKQDTFRLSAIQIVGTRVLPKEMVRAALRVHEGENIFSVRSRAKERMLMQRFPTMEDVDVCKYYPDKLLVRVRERTPIARSITSAQRLLMDEHGALFPDLEPATPLLLIDPRFVRSKEQRHETLRFLSLIRAYAGQSFFQAIRCCVPSDDGTTIDCVMRSGVTISLGTITKDSLKQKMRYLSHAYKDMHTKGIHPLRITMSQFVTNHDYIIVKKNTPTVPLQKDEKKC